MSHVQDVGRVITPLGDKSMLLMIFAILAWSIFDLLYAYKLGIVNPPAKAKSSASK
jgi:hypothetical protein